jgi:hypothetical protein
MALSLAELEPSPQRGSPLPETWTGGPVPEREAEKETIDREESSQYATVVGTMVMAGGILVRRRGRWTAVGKSD